MLSQFIRENLVSYQTSFDDWESAVRASCERLKATGYINQSYIDSIIECIHQHGPYIVIVPGIAMPHSTEGGEGVYKTGIAFMKVEEAVAFAGDDETKKANLFFTLAAEDHEKHLENMTKLMELLLQEEVVEELKQTRSIEDLKALALKHNL